MRPAFGKQKKRKRERHAFCVHCIKGVDMQKRIRIAALALAVAAITLGCSAQADPLTDKLKATLQTRLGDDVEIKSISRTPVAGLYEVNLGTQILYSDATGDYLLLGDLIEAKTRTNLTEERLAEVSKIDFASLPLGNAVKVVKGDGSRRIAVFSDPNCGYCKLLETTLKSVDNITVYTFLYPVMSPDSALKAKSIWCSADRAKAWESWMIDHRAPGAAGTCDTTAIDKNLALARELNIDGTPTVFLSDGRRLPGAVPADRLDKALSAVH
jgi:thiol:disulfide interchange protein DsbC